MNFIVLAHAVDAAWAHDIDPLLSTCTLSITRPTWSLGPRAVAPQVAYGDAEAKAHQRSASRVILRADIQNFYPSIYTHSIPWALHTKPIAKANIRNASLAGNRIDKAIRDGQDGQTMGVPIGCDTSWILAECILARIEEGLRSKLGVLNGHRYTDDFELYFATAREAEAALGNLQEVLAEYELSVNPRKTRIGEMPTPLEGDGVADLRRWRFRASAKGQRTDVVGYFDLLAAFIARDRGGHLASYASARLRTESFLPSTWSLLEAMLLHLLLAEPYCAKQIAMTLSMLTSSGHQVNPTRLTETVEKLVIYHAPLGHGSEVAWGLWLSLAYGAPLSRAAADAVSTMDDCFVALLALHANAAGLVGSHLNTQLWAQNMTDDELHGPRWLLAYEALNKGWLSSATGVDYVAAHPFFGQLKGAGVSFYDQTRLHLSYQPHVLPAVVGGGGGPSPVPGQP